MPELPDLEVIKDVLNRKVAGLRIESVAVFRPLVVRPLRPSITPDGFLVGRTITEVRRRGKFLLLALADAPERLGPAGWVAINPMLAGRLHLTSGSARRRSRDYLALGLSEGSVLTYHDVEGLGKIYLTDDLARIPGYADLGPEALDPNLDLESFLARLRHYRGEIKGVLTRGAFVAGIGNAYADEILFEAGIFPMRSCSRLSREERERLYAAMRGVLAAAVEDLRVRVGEDIHIELRDALRVHNRKGQPCPRCGGTISEVKVGGRATSFCRHCQPGTMFD